MSAPLICYAGGKWRMAKRYPPPKHRTIVEPFAGGAGYSLHHAGPDHETILVEKDPRLAFLWRWLIGHASERDILAIPILDPGDRVDDPKLGLSRGQELLLSYNVNLASGPRLSQTRFRKWDERRRELVARTLHLVKGWRVFEGDGLDLEIEGPATYFVDPPYQHVAIYRETFTRFVELAQWVRTRKGQVIVCEGEGADWLPFGQAYVTQLHAQARRESVELVWTHDDGRKPHRARVTASMRPPAQVEMFGGMTNRMDLDGVGVT